MNLTLLSSDKNMNYFGAKELKCDEMKEAILLVDMRTNKIALNERCDLWLVSWEYKTFQGFQWFSMMQSERYYIPQWASENHPYARWSINIAIFRQSNKLKSFVNLPQDNLFKIHRAYFILGSDIMKSRTFFVCKNKVRHPELYCSKTSPILWPQARIELLKCKLFDMILIWKIPDQAKKHE